MNHIYDGSWQGLLSLCFDLYRRPETVTTIRANGAQGVLFGDADRHAPDPRKAARLEAYLQKHRLTWAFRLTFCSQAGDKDLRIFHGICALEAYSHRVFDHPDHIRLQDLARRVSRERHRWLGLLRFEANEAGWLTARFQPEANLLPLLITHFRRRLPSESLMLVDEGRRWAAISNPDGVFFLEPTIEQLATLHPCIEELRYQELFRLFHQHIAIADRHNPHLQQANMPKKYWPYLTEMQSR